MPPGPQGQQPVIVTNSMGTGMSTTEPGQAGATANPEMLVGLDAIRSAVAEQEHFDPIPATYHARNEIVSDSLFVDADVRYFANSLTLYGSVLIRNGAFAQVFSFIDNYGIIDNYGVIDIGVGDIV